MDEVKNHKALAAAHRKAKQKIRKIKEFGITSKKLILIRATTKAEEEGNDYNDHIAGQRMYIEGLVQWSGLTAQGKLDYEYDYLFSDVATEGEMLKDLEALAA